MAGDAYKGLEIEFRGETSSLSAALSELRKEASSCEGELKSIDRALELDPSNVELLGQRQRYASEQASVLRERLDAINRELASGDVERGSVAYDRLQRDLVNTQSRLEKAERAARDAGDALRDAGDGASAASSDIGKADRAARDAADSLDDLADQARRAGDELSGAVTAGVGAAAAGVVAFGADMDSAGATIEAAVGGSAEEAEKLTEVGRDLWDKGWAGSMEELTPALVDAYEILGDLDQQDMSTAVRGALTLERAYGSDVSESLRGVNVLMTAFGLSAKEATDLMVAGSQRGLNYTDELGDNLSEYAGRWGDAGVSATQYFSLLQAGVDAGAYSLDRVGDYLNEFMTSLGDGRMEEAMGGFSEQAQEVWQSYKDGGASALDIMNAVIAELQGTTDETERAAIMSDLWGSQGEDNAWSVISALGGVQDSYGGVSGAADQAAGAIEDSLANRAAGAVNQLKDALEPFAEEAVELLGQVADVVEDLAGWFSSLDEGTQDLIVNGALLAGALGPVVKVGSKVVKFGKGVASAFGGAGTAAASAGAATTGLAGGLAGVAGAAGGVIYGGLSLAAAWQSVGRDFEGTADSFDLASASMATMGLEIDATSQAARSAYSQLDQATIDNIASMNTWAEGFRGATAWAFKLIPGNVENFENEYQQMFNSLDAQTIGGWLAVQASMAAGGEGVTEQNRQTVEQILSAYEVMNRYLPDVSLQALQAMALAMSNSIPELANAGNMTAEQIIQAIRDTLLNPDYGAGATGTQGGSAVASGFASAEGEAYDGGLQVGAASAQGAEDGASASYGAGAQRGGEYAGGYASNEGGSYSAGEAVGEASTSGAEAGASGAYSAGEQSAGEYVSALDDMKGSASSSGAELSEEVLSQLKVNAIIFGTYGESSGGRYAMGLRNQKGAVDNSASILLNSATGPLQTNLYGYGYDAGSTYANGMYGAAGLVASASSYLAGVQATYLHHTTPDKGPLAGDDEWGYEMASNIAGSMLRGTSLLRDASNRLATTIAEPMREPRRADASRAAPMAGVVVKEMVVRSDQDIELISRRLYQLQTRRANRL